MNKNRFNSAADALAFILAGNATVTVLSKRTGTRFTYKVVQKDDNSPHFVMVLTGSDNESSYTYMACIFQGRTLRCTRNSKIRETAPSYIAFDWIWRNLMSGGISDQAEIWHEGKCGCCGRKLTTVDSVASGIGPVCAEKYSVDKRAA